MIYLVSNNLSLFEEDCYERISLAAAVNLVNSWECIQFHVETGGRNPHLVPLLCAQFVNKKEDTQIVVDCQNNNNILAFKPHPTKGDKYSLYIDQGAYDARCFDFISRFCGRTDIIERVEKGEFKVKPLFDLI